MQTAVSIQAPHLHSFDAIDFASNENSIPVELGSFHSVCKVCGTYENSCDLCQDGMRVEAFIPDAAGRPSILGKDGIGYVSIEKAEMK